MTEKRYGKKVDDVDDTIINITEDGNDFAWFLNDDYTDEQVDKIVQRLNEQHETIEELTCNTIEANIEINHINTIYEELGFDGVIEYAKDKLSQYGTVREIEKGLWLLATGGWSDHEHWISCLKDSVMSWKGHYMASTRGGGFYYTKKPYDDLEIRLKGDDE